MVASPVIHVRQTATRWPRGIAAPSLTATLG